MTYIKNRHLYKFFDEGHTIDDYQSSNYYKYWIENKCLGDPDKYLEFRLKVHEDIKENGIKNLVIVNKKKDKYFIVCGSGKASSMLALGKKVPVILSNRESSNIYLKKGDIDIKEHKYIINIPVRLASTRLPNKPLLKYKGKTLIENIYEPIKHLKPIILSENQEIKDLIPKTKLIKTKVKNGTERICKYLTKHKYDKIINLQGDQLGITEEHINIVAEHINEGQVVILTAALKPGEEKDINTVKVIMENNEHGLPRAKDFSRTKGDRKHLGLYGFHRNDLLKFMQFKSEREEKESIEILRFLENKIPIICASSKDYLPDINTQEDYNKLLENEDEDN